MSYETDGDPESDWLTRERWQRKLFAFLVSSCACFILAALVWPLSVSGFISKTSVKVEVGDAETAERQFEELLSRVVRSRTGDEQLRQFVQQVDLQLELRSEILTNLDFDAVRNSLSVKTVRQADSSQIRLEFAFRGNGTQDESALLRLVAEEVSAALVSESREAGSQDLIATNGQSLIESREKLDQLDWLISQIESDLATVQDSVAVLNQRQPAKTSAFRTASHTTSGATPTLESISQSLASIDTTTVRQRLAELKASNSPLAFGNSNWNWSQKVNTEPIGGMPELSPLILLGILSVIFGSVIASNYQAFNRRGFENVSRIASDLRIPVVATLPSQKKPDHANAKSETGRVAIPWANRVVSIARVVLFGLFLLTVGCCLINEDVRNAFLVNPFFGFSRIVWMFAGY